MWKSHNQYFSIMDLHRVQTSARRAPNPLTWISQLCRKDFKYSQGLGRIRKNSKVAWFYNFTSATQNSSLSYFCSLFNRHDECEYSFLIYGLLPAEIVSQWTALRGKKKEGAGGPICSDLQNRRPFIIMVIITQIEKPEANNVTLLFQAICNGVCSCHVKAC